MHNITGLILHLKRATARAENVAALQEGLPFPSEVCSAQDARDLTPQDVAAYNRGGLWPPKYPFQLTEAEVAVFLSYRAAWTQIANGTQTAGFIVEDDVALDEQSFAAAWNSVQPHVDQNCWIRFPWKQRDRGDLPVAQGGETTLLRATSVGLGMQAQLFGRETAKRLLSMTDTFDRPVDTFLQMTWVTGLTPLVVWPSGVRDISAEIGGSTLTKHRPGIAARLTREFRRMRYRRAVEKLSMRATGVSE